jgi:hypothetical protein
MPFDPTKPAGGSPNSSAEMRAQLTGLKSLIDAATVTLAQVGSTSTLTPGQPATADVILSNGTLIFTFGIPTGQPGEVTQAQLSNDLVNMSNYTMNQVLPLTSANSNAVQTLDTSFGDPPITADLETLRAKLNELILGLRR